MATFFATMIDKDRAQKPLEAETLSEALVKGEASFSLRLRYEDVHEDFVAYKRGAQASTLRSSFSYFTRSYELFSAGLEVEDVRALPDDDNYNDLQNGQIDDSVVADPEGTELNQAWVAYDIANTLFRYGRQTTDWDNSRFLGSNPWRQNVQSVSGLIVENETLDYLRISFGRLHRFESGLGDDNPLGKQNMDTGFLHFAYRGFLNSLFSVYTYQVDNQSDDDRWDSQTYGLRFSGEVKNEPSVRYAFEYARQSDAEDNPVSYDVDYFLVELGGTYNGWGVLGGWEHLGADGDGYFVTPLASLHDFQGVNDSFLNDGLGNIEGGIVDRYLTLSYSLDDSASLAVTHHDFNADKSRFYGSDLGTEWSVRGDYRYKNLELLLQYAEYNRENYGVDQRKFWVSLALAY